jgi:Family of unknown function (DUF5330)
MLFLLRTAFWLMIIVLLLPTDERQRSEVYGTAQAAVHDLATFCDRNPETCAKGKDAFGVLVQKAQFGARMLIDLINGNKGAGKGEGGTVIQDPEQGPGTDFPFEPSRFGPDGSQDTLNPDDREEAWGGPGT